MTPGTITGSLKGDDYLVHCLDKSMAVGLESSVFVDAIQEWEEK
jgi:multicomponent Na+:H+ antiporter subunit E